MSDDLVKVTLFIRREVYERMWTAAARNGISHTAVVNDYVESFDRIETTPAGSRIEITLLRDGKVLKLIVVRNDHAPRPARKTWWRRFRR